MLIRIAGETSVCDLLDERNLYDAGPAITIVRGVCRSWRYCVAGDDLLSMWERITLFNFPRVVQLRDCPATTWQTLTCDGWRKTYRAHRRVEFAAPPQWGGFIMRPTPFKPRPQLSDFLFIAEIYSNPLIEPHARTVGQMYLADSCKLDFTNSDGHLWPETKSPAIEQLLQPDADWNDVYVEFYVSRRDQPDQIAQFYVGGFTSGELAEATYFERVRPCGEHGMNLQFDAVVHDATGEVYFWLYHDTEDDGSEEFFDGTEEQLAEYFDLLVRARPNTGRSTRALITGSGALLSAHRRGLW